MATKTKESLTKLQERLRSIGACQDAREWAGSKTAKQAWATCKRADWLLWWLAKEGAEKRDLVKIACQFARMVLHLVPKGEERPRLAIEMAEKWAEDPTAENLEKVRKARRDAAADAADAAVYVAYAAADAAAYAAADAAAAAADARTKMQSKCCKLIRSTFSIPWTEDGE